MRRASAVLCMQMVASGIAVAIDDTAERERFEILTYASYARLNEERRAILEQIAEDRTVHGRSALPTGRRPSGATCVPTKQPSRRPSK
jgi:hypothetical protein